MWPNYINGYPQCCDIDSGSNGSGGGSGGGGGGGSGSTVALSPEEVVEWAIWPALEEHWPDITTLPGSPCAVCLMVSE